MTRKATRKTTNVELLNQLRDVLGGRRVSRGETDRLNYGRDLWPRSLLEVRQGQVPHQPDMIVWPETTEEVSRMLRICNEMRVPVVPFGAGSGLCGGAQPLCGGVVLDTKRMARIERIVPETQMIVCQTGIIGAHLENELNRHGLTMGHFPGSFGTSTLGGYLATRSAGMAATGYGKIEDMLISMQVVLADGSVNRTRTAPRRATGPDFNHLFLGSEGSLGVITSASMRAHMLPEARAYRALSFKKMDVGLDAVRQMLRLGLRPAIARLSDEADASTTLHALGVEAKDCVLLLVFEGRVARVDLEMKKALTIARELGGRDFGEATAQRWYGRRNSEQYRQSPLMTEEKLLLDTVDVSTVWANAAHLYTAMRKALSKKVSVLGVMPHAYPEGCSLAFTIISRVGSADDLAAYDAVWRLALDAAAQAGGALSHAHGIGRLKFDRLARQNPVAVELLRGMKRRLAPNDILNPGKLAPCTEGAC